MNRTFFLKIQFLVLQSVGWECKPSSFDAHSLTPIANTSNNQDSIIVCWETNYNVFDAIARWILNWANTWVLSSSSSPLLLLLLWKWFIDTARPIEEDTCTERQPYDKALCWISCFQLFFIFFSSHLVLFCLCCKKFTIIAGAFVCESEIKIEKKQKWSD